MEKLQKVICVLIIVSAFVLAQEYYEASGQTPAFTLAPGNTSGIIDTSDTSSARMVQRFESREFSISAARGSVTITLPFENQQGTADITFYNIAGRQVYHRAGYRDASFSLPTTRFAQGIYFARVLVNGNSYSHRFVVTQ